MTLGGRPTRREPCAGAPPRRARARAEKRFRRHFDHAGVGEAMLSLEGRFLAVNGAYSAITGYSAAQLLSLTASELTEVADAGREDEARRRLLAGGITAYDIEKRYRHRTGAVVHVVETVSMVTDDEARPLYLTSVVQDVTERRRAEEELRLLHAVSVAVSRAADTDGAMAAALRLVCEATGWECGQAWLPGPDGRLHPAPVWYHDTAEALLFRRATTPLTFGRGEGLPGTAWATAARVWVPDVGAARLPRATAAQAAGFTAAAAVPVLADGRVVAVLEFFLSVPGPEDERMIDVVSSVSSHVGSFFEQKVAESALRESEERYRATVQTANDAFVAMDAAGLVTDWNRQAERTFGWKADEVLGAPLCELIVPTEHREAHRRGLAHFLETGEGPALHQRLQLSALHRDGRQFPIELTIWPTSDRGAVRFNAFVHDVTQRYEAERALRQSEERYRGIVETAQEGVWVLDGRWRTTFANRKLADMLGVALDDMVGRSLLDFVDETRREAALALMRRHGDLAERTELLLRRADGSALWALLATSPAVDGDDHPSGVLAMVADITERKAAGDALLHQAFHDPLTGLPNRMLFLDRLGQALARRARDASGVVGVLFLDVDRFKWVNDSLGHAAGDHVLTTVAARLSAVLRPGDTVARFGGDEFAVLCQDLDDELHAIGVATRLVAALGDSFAVEDREIGITVSVGVALAGGTPCPSPEALLRDADTAMYRAKERGRDRVEVFDDAMRTAALARLETESALRRALEGGELRVHYQPVIELPTQRVVGVEALARWQTPDGRLVGPADFVPLAEETGLIVPVGAFVLTEACRQVTEWNHRRRRRGERPLTLAVNLSARQLTSPGVVELVADTAAASNLDPALLSLEITESVLMDDADSTRDALDALKRLGVTLAVDDFGTGYSTLLYLRRFPVDVLKIDRSFVSGLGDSGADFAIVAGVVGLAWALGLAAVAEGVETAEQAAALREMGCELAQGYHWSAPLPAERMEEWLERFVATPPSSAVAASRRTRVLVADDQGTVRHAVRTVLELDGAYEVVAEAGNGTEAVAMARLHQPDLVLLDLNMPGLAGLDALPGLRASAPAAKVIILTATERPVCLAPGGPEGADGWLEKETDLPALAERLPALLAPPSVP